MQRSIQPGGSGQRSIQPGGMGGQVKGQSSWGGVRSKVNPAGGQGGQVQPAGGGQVQLAGGVSILRPLAGAMPLAFTQEDFLVSIKFCHVDNTSYHSFEV